MWHYSLNWNQSEKLKHGPLWIAKLLTSWMSGLMKFPFRQQWKFYFIHSVKYDIECFNQPEINCTFQSTELSCRQQILLLTNQAEIKSNDEYNLAFLLLHLNFQPRQWKKNRNKLYLSLSKLKNSSSKWSFCAMVWLLFCAVQVCCRFPLHFGILNLYWGGKETLICKAEFYPPALELSFKTN